MYHAIAQFFSLHIVEQSPLKKNKSQIFFFLKDYKHILTEAPWNTVGYYYYLTLLGTTLIKLSHLYTWVKKTQSKRHRTSASCGLFHFIWNIHMSCVCTKLQSWELCHNYAHSSSLAAVLQFPLIPVQLCCFLGTEHNKFNISSVIFKSKNQQLNSFVLSSSS